MNLIKILCTASIKGIARKNGGASRDRFRSAGPKRPPEVGAISGPFRPRPSESEVGKFFFKSSNVPRFQNEGKGEKEIVHDKKKNVSHGKEIKCKP
ncbi:hypothetical protein CEXT_620541 [Caerostris extrusa]|uniref:Uncharacterized protein n=1 Tax=Caerostris extrusa TaxID=172846 RepID=A0AAV4QPJ1_CAEEX|nr:hypothetical protein CEXT_620541 [Caerostris extrusa]